MFCTEVYIFRESIYIPLSKAVMKLNFHLIRKKENIMFIERSVLHEPNNRKFTIFINWVIIIIACCNKRTSSCSPKVGSTKILQGSARKHVHTVNRHWLVHMFTKLITSKIKGTKLHTAHHIVVVKSSTSFKKTCNGKSKVLNRSMRNWISKWFKPAPSSFKMFTFLL